MSDLPISTWLCTDCGTSSMKGTLEEHECQPDILVAHQRETFDMRLQEYYRSREGQFAVYCAQRAIARSLTYHD